MTTIEKIYKLNKECRGSLGFAHYTACGWQIHSYGANTPLNMENHYPYLQDKSFMRLVNRAYKLVFGGKK